MNGLYPPLHPYVRHTLAVEPPHALHVEECGNPCGIPVLFVHGGPGGGCDPYHRQYFDPEVYRIVLFDQRGCGQSTPHGELEGNDTQALVRDMEFIRTHLGIERWLLFGGSWGSTLSLIYAQAHPQRVTGLVLRGIFLCRDRDIHWFYQEGAGRLFPEHWEEYLAPIPPEEQDDLVAAYHRRLTGADEVQRLVAARAWSVWEGRTSTLLPKPSLAEHFGEAHRALAMARIECHYFMHKSFLVEDQILRAIDRIRDLPAFIVHGRYDVVCPVEQAWALHRAWPEAELRIIDDAGHSAGEPATVDALVGATKRFAERLA
jgi:proline iminopeptidase